MSDLEWVAEPRDVPVELTPEFVHADYLPAEPVFFPTLADRLDSATRDMLLAMAKGTL